MYDLPTEENSVDQGCLVLTTLFKEHYESGLAIVMTPQCDLEHKADFVSLAGVGFPKEVFNRLGLDSKTKIRGRVGGLVSGREHRWYFLQPTGTVSGFDVGAFVDFQLIVSVSPEHVRNLEVAAVISSPWCHELASKYAAFAGRVGTPDVPQETHQNWRRGLIDIS